MTQRDRELDEILRRALHAAAGSVEPADDGLERIRARLTTPRPLPIAWLTAGYAAVARRAAGAVPSVSGWLRSVPGALRGPAPGHARRRPWRLSPAAVLAMAAFVVAAGVIGLTPLPQQAMSQTASLIHSLSGGQPSTPGNAAGGGVYGQGTGLGPGVGSPAGTAASGAGSQPQPSGGCTATPSPAALAPAPCLSPSPSASATCQSPAASPPASAGATPSATPSGGAPTAGCPAAPASSPPASTPTPTSPAPTTSPPATPSPSTSPSLPSPSPSTSEPGSAAPAGTDGQSPAASTEPGG